LSPATVLLSARRLGAQCLLTLAEAELVPLLPSLSLALHRELFVDSPLARVLLARAAQSEPVGRALFWPLWVRPAARGCAGWGRC
jgi:hypothetical protein